MGSDQRGRRGGARRRRVRRLARHAAAGGQVEEDRHAGLLHGRTAGDAHRGGGAEPHRCRRIVPWRRPGDRSARTVRICSRRRSRRGSTIGIASNDDQRQPDAKDKLREAFDAAKVPAEIEVYKSLHGWCVPDMPAGATARRSTTSPKPRRRGPNCSRCTKPRWPDYLTSIGARQSWVSSPDSGNQLLKLPSVAATMTTGDTLFGLKLDPPAPSALARVAS